MAFPSNLNTASSYRSLFKSLSLLLLLLALVACSITAVAAAGDVVSDDFDDLDMDIDNGQGFAHIEDSTDSPEDLAYENKKFYHDVPGAAAARANFAVKFNKPVDAVWKLLTVQEQYPIWRKSVYAATFVERPDMENKVIVEKTLFGETHYEVTETGIVTVPIIRFLWSTYGFDSDVVRLLKDLGSALGQKKVDIVRPVNGKLPF
ncbi:hypothetical protein BSLG_002500 [Batrachochytrium salamandrivorans]|nr:hypothetical protein BSLG_002500 [Batrachochytrium salamandrivorans]